MGGPRILRPPAVPFQGPDIMLKVSRPSEHRYAGRVTVRIGACTPSERPIGPCNSRVCLLLLALRSYACRCTMACKPAVHSLGSTASPGRAGRSVLASRKKRCCVRAWSKKGDTDGTNRRLHDRLLDFDKTRNPKQALNMSFYKYHSIRNGALLLVVPRFRHPFLRPE